MLMQIKLNLYSMVYIGLGLGILLGLIPLILGFIKRKQKYAVFGFLGSAIGGGILGVFLSVPVAAIFTWLILRKSEPAEVVAAGESSVDVSAGDSKNT